MACRLCTTGKTKPKIILKDVASKKHEGKSGLNYKKKKNSTLEEDNKNLKRFGGACSDVLGWATVG